MEYTLNLTTDEIEILEVVLKNQVDRYCDHATAARKDGAEGVAANIDGLARRVELIQNRVYDLIS